MEQKIVEKRKKEQNTMGDGKGDPVQMEVIYPFRNGDRLYMDHF